MNAPLSTEQVVQPSEPGWPTLYGGYCRLVTTHKRVGNQIYLGGYSITYDRHGVEVSRSENHWNCVMDCGDDKLATQTEGWLHE